MPSAIAQADERVDIILPNPHGTCCRPDSGEFAKADEFADSPRLERQPVSNLVDA